MNCHLHVGTSLWDSNPGRDIIACQLPARPTHDKQHKKLAYFSLRHVCLSIVTVSSVGKD